MHKQVTEDTQKESGSSGEQQMMVKEEELESSNTNKSKSYCYVNESQSNKSEEAKTSHRQFVDSTVEIGMLGKSELDLTGDTGKSVNE